MPTQILAGIDFSEISLAALSEAIEIARLRAPADLHVVTVVDGGGFQVDVEDTARTLRGLVAEKLFAPGARKGIRAFTHVRVGQPVDEIIDLAGEVHADLIVAGTHGRRGFSRAWLGSVAEHLVRLAPCPVTVVRPKVYEAARPSLEPEPPCPACLAKRNTTHGHKWWCERHSGHQENPHAYGYTAVFDVEHDAYGKLW